jgi:hypothetical protein
MSSKFNKEYFIGFDLCDNVYVVEYSHREDWLIWLSSPSSNLPKYAKKVGSNTWFSLGTSYVVFSRYRLEKEVMNKTGSKTKAMSSRYGLKKGQVVYLRCEVSAIKDNCVVAVRPVGMGFPSADFNVHRNDIVDLPNAGAERVNTRKPKSCRFMLL